MKKVKEKMDLSKCKEFLEGDKPTKCFFQKFRANAAKPTRIESILDKDNKPVHNLEGMLDIACEYFKNMFVDLQPNSHMVDYFLQFVKPLNTDSNLIVNIYVICLL